MEEKGAIEKAKENLQRSLDDILFSTLYSQEDADRDTRIILRELERKDKQNVYIKRKIKELADEMLKEYSSIEKELNIFLNDKNSTNADKIEHHKDVAIMQELSYIISSIDEILTKVGI